MSERFVPLIPLGQAPFRIGLPVPAATSEGPFEQVGRQTLWIRRLRAAVVSSTGVVLERCVLHLPTDHLGDSSGEEMERRWSATHAALVRATESTAGGSFPELVAPAAGEARTMPPLVYCSVPAAFFELPCPSCLGSLETCRDDALLARLDLPLYSSSSTRFLICRKCSTKKNKKKTTVVDPRQAIATGETTAEVQDAGQYLAGVAQSLAGEDDPKAPPSFRCADCPERAGCWGWSQAESASLELRGLEVIGSASGGPRWRVFTENTVPYLVTRPAMTPLEVFVERIGSEAMRRQEAEALPGIDHLLFGADQSGMDSVEILTLRLTAFRQAVRAVREHYRLFDRPHLDISSESLVVADAGAAPGLPGLWNFRVRLDPTSALEREELAEGVEVPVPPDDPVAPFFAPSVRDFLLTGNRTGELRTDRLTEEADGRWRIEGHLLDPRGVFPSPGPKDWVRIQWSEDRFGLGVSQAVARRDPRQRSGGGRGALALTTEPLALDGPAVDRIQRAGGVTLPDVTYRVFPLFGPPEDLYSLGMVYFLCILVNDTNDLGLVSDDLGLIGLGGEHGEALETRARELVVRNPESWGSSAVFFDAVDRAPSRPNLIPEELWTDIVGLGLGMVSASPGITGGEESGVALFDRVEAEVDARLRRLRALLFDRQPLNLEMQAVITELLDQE